MEKRMKQKDLPSVWATLLETFPIIFVMKVFRPDIPVMVN